MNSYRELEESIPLSHATPLTNETQGSIMEATTFDIKIKNYFDKLISRDEVKDHIFQDFGRLMQLGIALEHKNSTITEYCRKENHLRYPKESNKLILQTKQDDIQFSPFYEDEDKVEDYALSSKEYFIGRQVTLAIIREICEEKLTSTMTKNRYKTNAFHTHTHEAAHNKDVCKFLLSPLPEKERIRLIFDKVSDNETFLHMIQDNIDLCKFLVNQLPEDLKTTLILSKNLNGNTAFHTHVAANNQDMCKFLVNSLSEKERIRLILDKGSDNETFLHKIQNNIGLYKFLMNQLPEDLKINLILSKDFFKNTALHLHVAANNQDICEFLVNSLPQKERITLVLDKGRDDETFLHKINSNNIDLCMFLVNQLPEDLKTTLILSKNDYGNTALHTHVAANNENICKFLVTSVSETERIRFIFDKGRDDETFLHKINNNNIDLCNFLVNQLPDYLKTTLTLKKNRSGNTAFHTHVAANNEDMCKFIVNSLPENERIRLILDKDSRDETFLHKIKNNVHLCKFIMNQLPDDLKTTLILSKNRSGNTAFHTHVAANNEDMCKFIVNSLPENERIRLILDKDRDDETFLRKIKNNVDLCKFIMNQLPEDLKTTLILSKDLDGNTAFHNYVTANNQDMCEFLVNSLPEKERIRLILDKGSDNETFLHKIQNNIDLCKFLMNQLPDYLKLALILSKNDYGNTAFHDHIVANNQDMCEFLANSLPEKERIRLILDKGSGDETFLHKIQNNIGLCKFLMNQLPEDLKINLILSKDFFKNTALHLHVAANNQDICEFLVNSLTHDEKVKLILHKNFYMKTGLDLAIENNYESIIHFFLNQLLHETTKTISDCRTILDCGIYCSNKSLYELVISIIPDNMKLATLQNTDQEGDTILHKALQNKNLVMCKCLTSLISSLSENEKTKYLLVKNHVGYTAINYAIKFRDWNICCLLLDELPNQEKQKYIDSLDAKERMILLQEMSLLEERNKNKNFDNSLSSSCKRSESLKYDFPSEAIVQAEIVFPRNREPVPNQAKRSDQRIVIVGKSLSNHVDNSKLSLKVENTFFLYYLLKLKSVSRDFYRFCPTCYLHLSVKKLWTALSLGDPDSFIGDPFQNNNDDPDSQKPSFLKLYFDMNPDSNENSMNQKSLIKPSKDPPDKRIDINGSQGRGSNRQMLETRPPDPRYYIHEMSKKKPPDKKTYLPKDYLRSLFDLIRGIESIKLGLEDYKIKTFIKSLEPLLQEQSEHRPLFAWVERLLVDNYKLLKDLYRKREEYSQDFKRIKEHGKIYMELIKDYDSLKKFKEEGEVEKYIACRALVKLGLEMIPQELESVLVQHEIEGRHAHFLFWIITTDQELKNSLWFFSLGARKLLYSKLKEIESILEKKKVNLDQHRLQTLNEALRKIEGNQGKNEQNTKNCNVLFEEYSTSPETIENTLNISSPGSNISIITRQYLPFSGESPGDDRIDGLELPLSKKVKTEKLSRFP